MFLRSSKQKFSYTHGKNKITTIIAILMYLNISGTEIIAGSVLLHSLPNFVK
jgi:hypothetical protein